jgi:DNA-binding transcriptional ArsR family regulator
MAMTAPDVEIERVELAPAAALFRSLGDPARLVIVRRLTAGPARVTDLTSGLGLAQSTVSKHLACLRDCGLVTSEPVGRPSHRPGHRRWRSLGRNPVLARRQLLLTRPFPPRTIDPVALCTVRTRRTWDLAPT